MRQIAVGPRKGGDTLLRTFVFSVLALIAASPLMAQSPRLASIVNAASFANANLSNGAIGQGSIFVIFGERMGPAQLAGVASLPLPTALAGTSVRVTASNGQTRDAIMIYTSAGQLAGIMPSNTPAGTATVAVTYNGQTSPPLTMTVVENSPGIFSQNQQGFGPGVAFNFVSNASQPLNTVLAPAQPGQIVTVYGTGLGPISGDETRPQAVAVNRVPTVIVGGAEARVEYAGRSSCCSGLDQVNFRIPENVEGCLVPVAVISNDVVSNFTTVSIARQGQACTTTDGLTGTDLATLATNGVLRLGTVDLLKIQLSINPSLPNLIQESADASFARLPLNEYYASFNTESISPGSCIVSAEDPLEGEVANPRLTYLNAGSIAVRTPNQGSRTLTRLDTGLYSTIFNSFFQPFQFAYLDPGTYTVTGTGAGEIGAFTQNFTVSPLLNWTNQSSISVVNRRNPLTVTWTGGETGSLVLISGGSSFTDGGGTERTISFVCSERAERRTFTVPSNILRGLRASDEGFMVVLNFTAPVRVNPTPRGMDVVNLSAGSGIAKAVTFQ
jgi:uncharacterized protein (TIGR03437 family)